MTVRPFFDQATFTVTYLVFDPETRDAVVIDPVLDYDYAASQTATRSVAALEQVIRDEGLRVHYILETHAHADHLSGSQYLRSRLDARVAIGARITEVQETFKALFDLPADFPVDGSQFDRLLYDGETLSAGALSIRVLATPGHTPACVSYLIGDAVFTGDALFTEDYGVGRCDFPRGSAADLYRSVHDRLYALPDSTRVFVGHDYQPGGREVRWETSIGRSKECNVHLGQATPLEAFVRFRTERDAKLCAPRLLFPSVQVNVNAGRLPAPHADGRRYLSIPINLFHPTAEDGSEGR